MLNSMLTIQPLCITLS